MSGAFFTTTLSLSCPPVPVSVCLSVGIREVRLATLRPLGRGGVLGAPPVFKSGLQGLCWFSPCDLDSYHCEFATGPLSSFLGVATLGKG